ncbi:hypothetical protein CYMTET_16319 [Cymbomonas tetramitiformis]|uniref:Calcineurin-like phosphoesterase domain-containing protein n=1 Tax=Cymbomonas tetramitiformis TaxID=36881 RepID=A0AAE0GDN5_9CHLO|nr:hypothetical protein CYMTET_16319 [Cymbomonas tetramitiformis]|eukprot:gene8017-9526_t
MQRVYEINGEPCLDYKMDYCRTPSYARSVFKLMREKRVDLVVHAGDFDYESSPRTWDNFLTQELQGMCYLAAKGNHDSNCDEGAPDPSACRDDPDRDRWGGGLFDGTQGYSSYLKQHQPGNAICQGNYGVDYSCSYKGVFFVFSSVGVERAGEGANRKHVQFIREQLSQSSAMWKVCVWHMTMEDMQTTYKSDATGWDAYETCRKAGAFIVTGHSHAYARSHEIKKYAYEKYGHHYTDLQVSTWDKHEVNLYAGLEQGRNAVAVVGVGGFKNEPTLREGDHWARIYSTKCIQDECYTADENDVNRFGALICEFDEIKNWAYCEFLATDHSKIDHFTLVSHISVD